MKYLEHLTRLLDTINKIIRSVTRLIELVEFLSKLI